MAKRKGPKRKCEKCGAMYHPRSKECPNGHANPTLKAVKRTVRKPKPESDEITVDDLPMRNSPITAEELKAAKDWVEKEFAGDSERAGSILVQSPLASSPQVQRMIKVLDEYRQLTTPNIVKAEPPITARGKGK